MGDLIEARTYLHCVRHARLIVVLMPELPEVEYARRRLLSFASGARIVRAEVHADTVLGGQREKVFTRALTGRQIEAATRRGKSLLVSLSGGAGLAMHLGMSGSLAFASTSAERSRHARVTLHLERDDGSAGTIDFDDPRKFGRLFAGPLADARAAAKYDALGPDAATILDAKAFAARLEDARGPIKSALMDQSRIAGLGNIHVGEALFLACVHPMTKVPSLDRAALARLYAGMRETIDRALENLDQLDAQGEPLVYVSAGGANPFLVYDREGEACPRCARAITREAHAGRSTFVCRSCQRPPRAPRAQKLKPS